MGYRSIRVRILRTGYGGSLNFEVPDQCQGQVPRPSVDVTPVSKLLDRVPIVEQRFPNSANSIFVSSPIRIQSLGTL